MTILLRTLCGCEKVVEIDGDTVRHSPDPTVAIPIASNRMIRWVEGLSADPGFVKTRVFRWNQDTSAWPLVFTEQADF